MFTPSWSYSYSDMNKRKGNSQKEIFIISRASAVYDKSKQIIRRDWVKLQFLKRLIRR